MVGSCGHIRLGIDSEFIAGFDDRANDATCFGATGDKVFQIPVCSCYFHGVRFTRFPKLNRFYWAPREFSGPSLFAFEKCSWNSDGRRDETLTVFAHGKDTPTAATAGRPIASGLLPDWLTRTNRSGQRLALRTKLGCLHFLGPLHRLIFSLRIAYGLSQHLVQLSLGSLRFPLGRLPLCHFGYVGMQEGKLNPIWAARRCQKRAAGRLQNCLMSVIVSVGATGNHS